MAVIVKHTTGDCCYVVEKIKCCQPTFIMMIIMVFEKYGGWLEFVLPLFYL